MSDQQEYRRYAELCNQMAEESGFVTHRAALHSMAHAWLKLAAEEDRIADLVREVDNLFSAPGGALNVRDLRAWGAGSPSRLQ